VEEGGFRAHYPRSEIQMEQFQKILDHLKITEGWNSMIAIWDRYLGSLNISLINWCGQTIHKVFESKHNQRIIQSGEINHFKEIKGLYFNGFFDNLFYCKNTTRKYEYGAEDDDVQFEPSWVVYLDPKTGKQYKIMDDLNFLAQSVPKRYGHCSNSTLNNGVEVD